MKPILAVALLLLLPATTVSQDLSTENIFLITLDGLRWQELYSGADSVLLNDKAYVSGIDALKNDFWAGSATERRELLMPFFWNVIGNSGQLYGNVELGSSVRVTNNHWFSYPGYNEILTGYADPRIDSNSKIDNPNKTVLEFVNEHPDFSGRVAAFGSWDVFPYIINANRSGIPVNAGFEPASGDGLTQREVFLNELQSQMPSPWSTVRLDAFTHGFAFEHLKKNRPRLLYIAYGETDDFAHDADYDAYLYAASRTDGFIRELWEWVQADEEYRDKTTFLITTDHGRGEADEWTGHGTQIEGADQIWFAVIGPDTSALGEISGGTELYQNQVAATVAAFLGLEYQENREFGTAVDRMIGQ